MDASTIAAKAHAFEIETHVGHALDARQSASEMEALGRGAGSEPETHDRVMHRAHLFNKKED